MAVTPLDLQTLFSQIDKIGKEVASQKDGALLHEAIMSSILRQKAQEKMKTVSEAGNSGEGPGRLRAEQKKHSGAGGSGGHGRGREEERGGEERGKPLPLRDPDIGKYVDISG